MIAYINVYARDSDGKNPVRIAWEETSLRAVAEAIMEAELNGLVVDAHYYANAHSIFCWYTPHPPNWFCDKGENIRRELLALMNKDNPQ